METTKKYSNWRKNFGFQIENGKLMYYNGFGCGEQDLEYHGEGVPFACQAVRQSLLLGTFDTETMILKKDDVLFGIKEINHSYNDWSGDVFQDYDIEILHGTKEDVVKCFDESSKIWCVIGCEQCCGCGDW